MATEKIVNLDPSKILADDNAARYSLHPHKVERLAADIAASGGVQSPIEVEPLTEPNNGYTHRLTFGNYRLAAVNLLNSKGAGLTIPAIPRKTDGELDRVRRQVRENHERENMSPMDEAVAIRRLLDAGVSKSEVRDIFARAGGRKGLKVQPASNSHVNMVLSFLDLPNDVQEKIHDGRVTVSTAYELTKVEPEKRTEVLERAEASRLRAIDKEEKEDARESKGVESDAKKQEREAAKLVKLAALTKTEEETGQVLNNAIAAHEAAVAAERESSRTGPLEEQHGGTSFHELPAEVRKQWAENRGAAKAALKTAAKAVKDATNKHNKASVALRKATSPAPTEAPATEPVAAPVKAAKATKAAKVTPADVKRAAKEAGSKAAKPVQLKIGEAITAATTLAKAKNRKVAAIGVIFKALLLGELSVGEASKRLEATA